MLQRRLLWLTAVASTLAYLLISGSYLSWFLFALSIALPLLSLLLSLPAMAGCRVTLGARPYATVGEGEDQWRVAVSSPRFFPVPRVSLRLTAVQLLTGKRTAIRRVLSGAALEEPTPHPADITHCGLLELSAARVRVYDYLGLFALPRRAPAPARLLVIPRPVHPGPLHIPEGQGVHAEASSAAKKGVSEDYELREYRPGDLLRAVHWKLSSKWDDLIVRERSESRVPLPLFTFDRFGSPDRLDRALGRLSGCRQVLLAAQRPFAVQWLEGERPVLRVVSDEKEWTDCLLAILSTPLPRTGVSITERPALLAVPPGAFHLHFSGEEDEP